VTAGLTVAWSNTSAGVAQSPASPVVAATPPATTELVKFYIVGDPGNGQREYLFQIAVKTLGNGHRYLEIFTLNKGRLQPDGQRMVDPAVINPGWILRLPSDATGPGVQQGAMPYVASVATVPVTGGSQAARGEPARGIGMEDVVRVVALTIVTVMLVGSLRLLLRGARIAPPWRLSTAHPKLRPDPVNIDAHQSFLLSPESRRSRVVIPPSLAPQSFAELPPETEPTAATPIASSSRPLDQVASEAPLTPPAAGMRRRPLTFTESVLNTQVSNGTDIVAVRLAGARTQTTRPYAWVPVGEPGLERPGNIAIGVRGAAKLFIDLAVSPDVITMTGAASRLPRLVDSIARQLVHAGVAVTVVGDAVGATTPAGARVVSSYEELNGERPQAPLEVVFGTIARTQDLPHVRRLVSPANPRTVVVIVGQARRARWSIDIQSGQDAAPN
jgi:hypothetical protein